MRVLAAAPDPAARIELSSADTLARQIRVFWEREPAHGVRRVHLIAAQHRSRRGAAESRLRGRALARVEGHGIAVLLVC